MELYVIILEYYQYDPDEYYGCCREDLKRESTFSVVGVQNTFHKAWKLAFAEEFESNMDLENTDHDEDDIEYINFEKTLRDGTNIDQEIVEKWIENRTIYLEERSSGFEVYVEKVVCDF